jgi:cobalt-zinc-cadmium efflux system membrane fusion protein
MKRVSILLFFFIVQAFIFSQRCEGHSHQQEDHENCEFMWTKEKSELAHVQCAIAGPGVIQNRIHVSGKITLHPDYQALVYPKIEGIVWVVKKNIGDSVEKNETLALIESQEIAEAKARFLSAFKKFSIQKTLFNQEAALKGISAEQDYLKAKLEMEVAIEEYDIAIQKLLVLGFSFGEIQKIPEEDPQKRRYYEIKSPIEGKILERNLNIGERVNSSLRAFSIADFNKLWVEIHLAQRDAHDLKPALPITISNSYGRQANAHLCQFCPTISEETRMAKAVALLDNPQQEWIPGEYVGVSIITHAAELPLVISREAIQKIKGENYVFVEEGDHFTPRLVKLGKMDDQNVEILSGIQPGETYAACNSFCMKAEYEKEEVEHSH